MKKFKLLTAFAASALALAACDQVIKNEAVTQKAEESKPAAAVAQNATPTKKAAPAQQLELYYATPEQIVRQLDDYRNATTEEILKVIDEGYPAFLEQMANLPFSSPEREFVDKFGKEYVQQMVDSQTLFSINLQFATQLASEALLLDDSDGRYYPKASDEDQSYNSYRLAMKRQFQDSIRELGKRMKDPNVQKRYLLNQEQALDANAAIDKLTTDYVQVVEYLTKKDLYCVKQPDQKTQKECFEDYLELVAKLPQELATVYYLKVSDINLDDYVPPIFRENIIYSLLGYFNLYVKPYQLDQYSTK